MTHPGDAHQDAVQYANRKTREKYGCISEWGVGSAEHKYWLTQYDNRQSSIQADDDELRFHVP